MVHDRTLANLKRLEKTRGNCESHPRVGRITIDRRASLDDSWTRTHSENHRSTPASGHRHRRLSPPPPPILLFYLSLQVSSQVSLCSSGAPDRQRLTVLLSSMAIARILSKLSSESYAPVKPSNLKVLWRLWPTLRDRQIGTALIESRVTDSTNI
jgi:hypothetical protein